MILPFIFRNHFFVYLGFLIIHFQCSQTNVDITHGINNLTIYYKTEPFKNINILPISMSAVYRRVYFVDDRSQISSKIDFFSLCRNVDSIMTSITDYRSYRGKT